MARKIARIRVGACLLSFLTTSAVFAASASAQAPAYLTQGGAYGSGNGQFESPRGVATDAAGNVYVADVDSSRIQEFTSRS